MWVYEKLLEFPVNITKRDLKAAKIILTQYGGDDGELRAAIRYLNQRFNMPTNESKALLTDIGTEELAHIEIIQTLIYKLTYGASIEELKANGFEENYAMHGVGMYPTDAALVPMSVVGIGSHGNDFEANLVEDLAAEEKARATYEHLMDLTNNVEVLSPLAFLREREIVHFERFLEMLNILCKKKNS